MDISYILTIILMTLILTLGITGVYYPNKIVNYYLKYTKNHSKVIKIISKSWFYRSFKISSVLLILYSIIIIILLIKKVLS